MTTRSAQQDLLPETDPNLIIRASNAEKRKAKLLAESEARIATVKANAEARKSQGNPAASKPSPPPKTEASPPSSKAMSTPLPSSSKLGETAKEGGKASTTDPTAKTETISSTGPTTLTYDNVPLDQFMRFVMKTQHQSLLSAEADRVAASERINVLEQAVLKLSTAAGQPSRTTTPGPGRVDLQKFRLSDGPVFRGPFGEIEPFLKWIRGIQIFFSTKEVTHAEDKVRIVGSLIEETNLLAFYHNGSETYIGGTWKEFKTALFDFALPPCWRTDLKEQIQHLQMLDSESFLAYSTRARTLQSLHNFDEAGITDLELAQFVTFGTAGALRGKIDDFELLERVPFVYATFEKKASGYHKNLKVHQATKDLPVPPIGHVQQTKHLTKDKFIWRIHAYLDSQGLCHFCKKACGSDPGTCPGPLDRSIVPIPPSFVAPPKPLDYKRPKPRNGSQSQAGKPTHPPAGRPPTKVAAVAALAEDEMYAALDEAAVSAIQVLDDELEIARTEKTLEAAINKEARVAAVQVSEENFFPELDRAAVDALEELDQHLATLRGNGSGEILADEARLLANSPPLPEL
ncbi:hypothetical protein PGT21_006160 [Puccinia graminis f. sp. tritici]|uniref:Retrotransposon gag domain-containing protein n=1 Tax=Puccinia graminis f. sp. tritici TaxID=56615 RepID=A0A5B0NIR0_PUCGR|nr:hypothetical protein PGTUg99_026155 [Puccinia graminis f. sp. tritici]KAA1105403.1 hypothetical protein PGT21_006160 [Puccinia graminis f. sp. tritici]